MICIGGVEVPSKVQPCLSCVCQAFPVCQTGSKECSDAKVLKFPFQKERSDNSYDNVPVTVRVWGVPEL